ncbi:MAG: tetratricopeptide repeat protein [Promethearchaeota archaeon]
MPTKSDALESKNMSDMQFQTYSELSRSDPLKLITIITPLVKKKIPARDKIRMYNLLGHIHWTLGNLKKSLKYYKMAYSGATKLDDEECFADSLVGLGILENTTGEFETANEKFIQSIAIYQKLNLQGKEAHATNRYGINRMYLGMFDEGLGLLNRSAELAHCSNEEHIELSARNNIALIQMNRGDIESASQQFKICSEIAQKIGFKRGYVSTLSNYAEAIQNMGKYKEAEINFRKALKVAEETKDIMGIANIKTEMGKFFIEMGKLEKARKYLDDAMKIYNSIDEKFNYIQCLNAYAIYWLANGKFQKGIEVLGQALKIIEDTNLSERKVQILVTLAQAHHSLRNLDIAYSHLKEATKLASEQDHQVGKGLILIERARLSLAYSNYHEAELLLMEAQEVAEKSHHFEIFFNSLLLLTQAKIVKARTHRSSDDLEEIINLVEEGLKISKKKKLWPRYLSVLILRSILYAFEDQIPKALDGLAKAQTQAEKQNMQRSLQEIRRITPLVGSLDNPWNREMIFRQIESILTQEIQRITTSGISFQFTPEDVEASFIMTYKIDEKRGTILHACENVQTEDPHSLNLLNTAGSVYIMSLGRGQEYHQGLFGPFPYGKENTRAIVYSVIKEDPALVETRSLGHIFLVTAYIYPEQLSPLFNDREKLEDIFVNQFGTITDIDEITPEFLQQIRTDIADYFLKPFLHND